MTTITIPIDVVEAASAALGNFVSDHGWSDSDMQAMDTLDSYIARHKAIRAELARPVEPVTPVAWHDAPEVAALKAERDELLAALQGVAQMSRCGQLDQFIGEPWLNSVFAAIAKAGGKTE